ncbi:hypothetical protein BO78DRAFT_458104 [Aspergillus sclerotiicarbonarius CBS 121057]|uniref:C2 NT-type domain-containing protein n=1 Tax=Aspergillus sclerotiicarbonarius (strain CBS 121057 / IBT 28362) TaxID=1448318 RepID=A0A319ETA3_ASPSB|nr:hypothetical protein BO78DRAFT_458104 [Aspergillus sclerotiicarbonarius CBS 121057]
MQAFVPKNRRPRFELVLRIIDLNNIPLVSGTAFVKWRLPSSSATEHHGHTDKAIIIDHRASWNYEKVLQVRLTIDRNQTLHECELYFEIIQEFASGGNNDKNLLGRIRLNLSEYVDKSDDDEGIVRRYLMQDSKINSTLKVGIATRQVEGDRNFITPPLKSAMVFGGIAGVVSSEQSEHDDLGRLPTINTQSREVTDMQDMYRRTLAASWNSRADDLPADKLIEELFSGGISWADSLDAHAEKSVDHQADRLSPHGHSGARQIFSDNRLSPPSFERRPRSSSSNHHRNDAKGTESVPPIDHARKGGSIEQQLYDNPKGKAWKNRSSEFELSEFDVREDLRSWEVMNQDAAGLLSCRLLPECRAGFLPPSLRRRNVAIRFESTESDAKDTPPSSPPPPRPPRHRRPHRRSRGKKVPISVSSLGNPGEVVVVQERQRRQLRKAKKEPTEVFDKTALPFFLREIENDDDYVDGELLKRRVESFRANHQPQHKLTVADWKDLRNELESSFTYRQLSDYIAETREDSWTRDMTKVAQWTPGISEFVETGDLSSRRGIADRVAPSQALKGKYLLAERILRDCWHLGVLDEVGQLDIHLPTQALSLLLNSQHFSFEELASLHDANIDVMHSLGLVRITGRQRTCESISEIIHDTTTRVRQEDIELPPDETRTKVNNRIFTSDFLSWVTKTYRVAFEQTTPHTPTQVFYLVENKQDADNARRALNLAYYGATAPPVPFSTYVPSTEPASVHDVDPEHNTTWPDREKAWFRWATPATQSPEISPLDTQFFDNHQTRLSDELFKLLRQKPVTYNANQETSADVHESVTAAVGKCLFLRKPFFEESSVNASQLGKMSLPRTFTTDIPRAAQFLRMLAPQPVDEHQQAHRIRLVPSALNVNVFPQLELEVTAKTNRRPDDPDPELAMRSAKLILAESNVDYLLPENGLDLRFTRKLTRELLTRPQDSFSLEALEECLRSLFTRSITSDGELPLPAFTQVTLPRDILGQDTTSTEYMFLPVSDIRGTRIHRYDFRGQQLNYAFYESGPFNPYQTSDLFLTMDMANGDSASGESVSETDVSRDALQDNFHTFYKTACALAFDLDKARRLEASWDSTGAI